MLHKRLKQARQACGMTQIEAAKSLGVTQAFMSKLEVGQSRPNVEMLRKLAKLYGATETYLIGDTQAREAEQGGGQAVGAILADDAAQPGLVDLASNRELSDALGITDAEWSALRSLKVDCTPSASGYIQILAAIRGACPGWRENRVSNSRHEQSKTDENCHDSEHGDSASD